MPSFRTLAAVLPLAAISLLACGSDADLQSPVTPRDGGGAIDLGASPAEGDAAADPADASAVDAAVAVDPDFAAAVVSFAPGGCAGFGRASYPGVVLGPPHGGGSGQGSLDVLTLGAGGSIVLDLGERGVVDGPGVDLIVFENAFYVGGNASKPVADLGEVSVSEDGVTWTTWPCTAKEFPYGACAGWHAVFSAPGNGIAATDVDRAGGDQFDLADIGVARARYLRIVDMTRAPCTDAQGPGMTGFDLDAVAIVHRAAE